MQKIKPISKLEFVGLMAFLTAILPLAIDGMLPAFPQISQSLHVSSPDKLQLIIAVLFLGFGCGQFIFGPISDVVGRKPPIYWGIGIFIIGSVISGVATNYEVFLLGRFLQGFGAAAPRIISLALIRDEYSGNAMAQITSLIMTVFILVPAVAPALGQTVLFFAGWREIFILLFAMGAIAWFWFALRQIETLPKELRTPLTVKNFSYGVKEVFSKKTTLICMIITGLIFGIFIGYLGAIQSIFSDLFNVTTMFPTYFALLALSIGAASFFNSRIVMVLGTRRLIKIAFISLITLSSSLYLYLHFVHHSEPPLWLFMAYMSLSFFTIGFLFGNLNAIAMEPLGHVAGMGSALLGFVQSFISVILGVQLGKYFHGSVIPLILSFGIIGFISLIIFSFESGLKKPV